MTMNNSYQKAARRSGYINHMCGLDVDAPVHVQKRTGVICTIGPACDSVDVLKQLIETGMNIARIVMAHGDYQKHLSTIEKIREAESQVENAMVAIAIDIGGPGVKFGLLKPELNGELVLSVGDKVKLTSDSSYEHSCDAENLYINSIGFINRTNVKDMVYIDDGPLCLLVMSKGSDFLECVVQAGGEMNSYDGCHVPGVLPGQPNLTEKDQKDIGFAIRYEVDIIFVSWVWCPSLIQLVRLELGTQADQIQVIAKIENHEGVKRYKEILKVSDGTLVSRGHLGVDLLPEKVFLAQKIMIGQSCKAGKPVICASQMLQSMMSRPRPTRAEAGDVANAILDGADCVLLSGETAIGKYPVKAVETVVAICQEAEAAVASESLFRDLRRLAPTTHDVTQTLAVTAVEAVIRSKATAILLVTSSGRSASMISQYRPPCHIVAITRVPHIARSLHLSWGILPVLYEGEEVDDWHVDVDNRFHHGLRVAAGRKIIKPGDTVVMVTGMMAICSSTNTARIMTVPELDNLLPITNININVN